MTASEGHRHRIVRHMAPLATGWRIVTYDEGDKKPTENPLAALACVDVWDCPYIPPCTKPLRCREDSDISQAFYPVWAAGFNVIGDNFLMEHDTKFIILGPGETLTDELRAYLAEET